MPTSAVSDPLNPVTGPRPLVRLGDRALRLTLCPSSVRRDAAQDQPLDRAGIRRPEESARVVQAANVIEDDDNRKPLEEHTRWYAFAAAR
jgi:hypothetical protein